MFNKHFSLGRAALLAALVLFLSVGFTSCQPQTETKYVDKIVYKYVLPLEETDPICGEWQGAFGLAFYCSPDFVWATASSGKQLAAEETGCVTLGVMNWSTFEEEDTYYAKSSTKTYVVYKSDDKKSGVVLFKAEESPWGTPAVGNWYGVKFQIDETDSSEALIEGAAGTAYNNIATLAEAVETFAFDNKDCFSPDYWNESGSGASKVTE